MCARTNHRAAGGYPWLSLQLVTQRQSNLARLNLGSVAAMVLAAIVVLLLGAGSYMVSSRMNRDADRREQREGAQLARRHQ